MLVPCENFFRKPSEAYAEQKCSASTETDRRAEFSEQKQLHQHLSGVTWYRRFAISDGGTTGHDSVDLLETL
jgi:hypothetical protein